MTGVSSGAHPARAGRSLLWTGLAVLVAGLTVLGYLGWQLWGTNYASARKQARITAELEQSWNRGQDRVHTDVGFASAVLKVPRFGSDFAVPVLEGVGDDVLSSGVGHFDHSVGPGQVGNFALAGHRITHGEPFADLPQLRAGDEVLIETWDRVYTYELDHAGDDLVVPFTATWVVETVPVNPTEGGIRAEVPPQAERLITLTTCAELFHTDDRLVVFGHLVASRARGR